VEASIIGLVSKVQKELFLCPECGGQVISIPESAEDVCSQCGLIINEKKIDFTSNGKRAYTSEEKKARETTGSPISILMPDMALSTVINRSESL
jgi:transcription initiation factor TFIIB